MDRSSEDERGSHTGDGSFSKEDVETADERARRSVVATIVEAEDTADVATDGGLSDAARAYLENTPDATLMDAYAFDKGCGTSVDGDRGARLPPRGDVGDEQNYERAYQSNREQYLLRRFEGFEERTD